MNLKKSVKVETLEQNYILENFTFVSFWLTLKDPCLLRIKFYCIFDSFKFYVNGCHTLYTNKRRWKLRERIHRDVSGVVEIWNQNSKGFQPTIKGFMTCHGLRCDVVAFSLSTALIMVASISNNFFPSLWNVIQSKNKTFGVRPRAGQKLPMNVYKVPFIERYFDFISHFRAFKFMALSNLMNGAASRIWQSIISTNI